MIRKDLSGWMLLAVGRGGVKSSEGEGTWDDPEHCRRRDRARSQAA